MPDPTLLLDPQQYKRLCSGIKQNTSSYIFKYILKDTDEKARFISDTANKLSLPVYSHTKNSAVDWLAKIRDCKLVVTDSYHGVLFSIILNKPFIY